MFVDKGVISNISFTKWVKDFLNFKPQRVANFTASAALIGAIAENRAPSIYGKMATAVFRLMSLYWRRMNRHGALAGILSGGIMVIVWRVFIRNHFDLTGVCI